MTDSLRRSLEAYIHHLAALLRLADWRIRLATEPAADGQNAQAYQPFDARRTYIRVRDGWLDMEPEEQRDTIVHELLHLHLAEMSGMINDDTGELLDKAAYHILHEQYRLAEERAVDTLAGAIAPLLPLWDPKVVIGTMTRNQRAGS